VAVPFDLFGTLVGAERPATPAVAVATALHERGVSVPDDWSRAYHESHVPGPEGAELALSEHVRAALASRGVDASPGIVLAAVGDRLDGERGGDPG
jgi:hypothetical protein